MGENWNKRKAGFLSREERIRIRSGELIKKPEQGTWMLGEATIAPPLLLHIG